MMSLSALTDRAAVLQAMAEFDEIGRDAFLARYSYGPARTYFVLHEGRRYDSKALAGAAVGKQFPDDGPLKAAVFSGGEATVKAKFEQLEFEVETGSGNAPRNPDWTREETILAMDLYARRRPQLPGEGDLEIIELSEFLRAYADQRRVVGTATFRNPNGVSMKVGNLSRLDDDDGRKGLPHGSAMEVRVWAEFMPDVAKLRAAADAIRASIGGPAATPEPPPSSPSQVESGGETVVSRGPRPSFGEIVQIREDGENSVYLMRLYGAVATLFPKRAMNNLAVLKIGRSNDVRRRAAELNCGFPPGLDLAWRPWQAQTFPTANAAHDVEQALLRTLEARGLTIGGEFAIVPERDVEILLADAMRPPGVD
jgi:hypothetical protein